MELKEKDVSKDVKRGTLFLSIVLIAAGFLIMAFNLGWLTPDLKSILLSWPMIFILLAIFSVGKREYLHGVLFFLLACFFLLPRLTLAFPESLSWVDHNFTTKYWPVWLIFAGLFIVIKLFFGKNHLPFSKKKNSANHEDGYIDIDMVFNGTESIVLDPVFKGGEIDLVFGGVTLDLRHTALAEGVTTLDIDAIFGGVTLLLPINWNVVTRVDSVMGGVTDKRFVGSSVVDSERQLLIKGDFVFAGLEIK